MNLCTGWPAAKSTATMAGCMVGRGHARHEQHFEFSPVGHCFKLTPLDSHQKPFPPVRPVMKIVMSQFPSGTVPSWLCQLLCRLSGEEENKVRVEKGSLPRGGLRASQGQHGEASAPCARGIHLGMASFLFEGKPQATHLGSWRHREL